MKEIKSILFLLDGYPICGSNACVFARNLICELADMGIQCVVVAPQIITKNTLKKRIPYYVADFTIKGNTIDVYSPLYLYASSRPSCLGISVSNHVAAVRRVIKKEQIQFDVVYGHFIYTCGLSAAVIGQRYCVPSFLSVGESDKLLPENTRNHGAYQIGLRRYKWNEILASHAGIICVSEWVKSLLIQGGFISISASTAVFPNGVRSSIFHPEDKLKMRHELSIPEKAFLVVFVGAFNHNKGAQRVSEAINQIDSDIYSVFIGREGECIPSCKNILFIGQCSNEKVARYMQAGDCFVLPTKSEGCCNSILEALSTGLPVISSDRPFNDGILTENNSIRINPENVTEIAEAIKKLKTNKPLLDSLSKGAISSSRGYDIKARAEKIYSYMVDCTQKSEFEKTKTVTRRTGYVD